jgi:hypothetical protein
VGATEVIEVRKFNPEVEAAIRGIRANFLPRRVMVFDRTAEWGGALVKAGGETWSIGDRGEIHRHD